MTHRPVNGQPISDLSTGATVQSGYLLMLADYQSNQLVPPREKLLADPAVECINTRNRLIEFGTVLRVTGPNLPPSGGGSPSPDLFRYNPQVLTSDPAWHTAIDNLVPVTENVPSSSAVDKADGGAWHGMAATTAMLRVRLGASPPTDRYLMLDPYGAYSPAGGNHVMRTSDAGVWKIIAIDLESSSSDGLRSALVDMRIGQPLWRYELTEDSQAPATTKAKLIRLDGDEFAPEIDLSDPLSLMDDQLEEDVGYCMNVGNAFHAINAPCGHADLITSSSSS